MTDQREYYNLQEAAEALGTSRRHIWRLVKDGQMEAITNPLDRREKLIPRSEVERLSQFARKNKETAG